MNKPTDKPWNNIFFWNSVKKDYFDKGCDFICNVSSVFEYFYQSKTNRRSLNVLANKFLKETGQKGKIHPWKDNEARGTALFNCKNENNDRPMRKKFINWNIQRLTKKA